MKKSGFFVLLVMAMTLSTQVCRAGTMVDFLAGTDCFQGLTQTELRAVAALGTVVPHKAGDQFITYGVPINRLFVMKTGKADVILKTGAVVAVAGPGTTLGEMEFVDGQPASANVVASIDAETIEFDPASLRDLLKNQPSIGHRVMGNMARKISGQLRGQQ
ncbi:MAG: cyclic nucleotide-binding domain-containing protein [Desulfotignum sp.]|nr:cyclic nucleotide-binding domain-containing protein [Desulfotignum sp.]